MNQRTALITAAIMGGLAVAIGAFGAHALRPTLEAYNRTDTFELAVRYQFYHTFAIFFTGVLMLYFPSRMLMRAAAAFTGGIVVFSGSLYVLSLTGVRWLGAITPVGGLLFIAGWVLLLIGIQSHKKK